MKQLAMGWLRARFIACDVEIKDPSFALTWEFLQELEAKSHAPGQETEPEETGRSGSELMDPRLRASSSTQRPDTKRLHQTGDQ